MSREGELGIGLVQEKARGKGGNRSRMDKRYHELKDGGWYGPSWWGPQALPPCR
jgi:hypothetical protein